MLRRGGWRGTRASVAMRPNCRGVGVESPLE